MRYQYYGSSGELWAQTTALRRLLGYYEITSDVRALNAAEKAMAVTMREYGPEGRNPFELENAFGGVTHGLMITDVCEILCRITGKNQYQDYAIYLYRAFSMFNINRAFNDLRYPYLLEWDSLFTGHGVHTYEHFRPLVNAFYHTGLPELKIALDNALHKLDKAVPPSGAGHGNEWLAGLEADPTYTHTEFCSMLELRNSLTSLFQKTGDIAYADHAELLTYNGIMGFRGPEGTAIVYGKGDNCYVVEGEYHGKHGNHQDVRYKYSPTHSDPAVCCVPNYSRNYPYLLDQIWLRANDGLVAAMYAPRVMTTTWDGIEVSITQQTGYPFSDKIKLKIELDEPVTFTLYLRVPHGISSLEITRADVTRSESEGFVILTRHWEDGDEISMAIHPEIIHQEWSAIEGYLQRGALIYALPIPHRQEVLKTYPGTDFTDFYC